MSSLYKSRLKDAARHAVTLAAEVSHDKGWRSIHQSTDCIERSAAAVGVAVIEWANARGSEKEIIDKALLVAADALILCAKLIPNAPRPEPVESPFLDRPVRQTDRPRVPFTARLSQ